MSVRGVIFPAEVDVITTVVILNRGNDNTEIADEDGYWAFEDKRPDLVTEFYKEDTKSPHRLLNWDVDAIWGMRCRWNKGSRSCL